MDLAFDDETRVQKLIMKVGLPSLLGALASNSATLETQSADLPSTDLVRMAS